MLPSLILIGGGGHCKSCIDVIETENKYHIAGIVDIQEKFGENILGYSIIAGDSDIASLHQNYSYFLITIGQIKKPTRRVDLFNQLKNMDLKLPSIVSPKAFVSNHAKIGEGSIVMHGAVINAGAFIGRNCIINTNAVIEHDVVIEDHCHISTGAIVNGETHIKYQSFIGSNSTLRQCIEVGENSVIGCGLKIIKSVPAKTFLK